MVSLERRQSFVAVENFIRTIPPFELDWLMVDSVTKKKLPIVYKSCPKMISPKNDRFWHFYKKLLMNVGDLGKLIVAKGFKDLPKDQ